MAETVAKRIRLSVVDFSTNEGLADRLLDWVVDRYDVRFVDRDAEYVLHSCYGYDVLKHPGVRIFLTGENVRPDFNLCDYAFGFDRLEFGDRYCRLPLYRLYRPVYERICRPRPPAGEALAAKSGFCAFVASNVEGDPARRRIVELLNAYRRVDMGGRWRNNVGGPVGNKYAFQSRYKFAIAFENTSTPGYTTEKIADAMASNAIPIYWGDPEAMRDFNPGAFVDCMALGSLDAAVERVRQIDRDDELCRKMLSEPWSATAASRSLFARNGTGRSWGIFSTPHGSRRTAGTVDAGAASTSGGWKRRSTDRTCRPCGISTGRSATCVTPGGSMRGVPLRWALRRTRSATTCRYPRRAVSPGLARTAESARDRPYPFSFGKASFPPSSLPRIFPPLH